MKQVVELIDYDRVHELIKEYVNEFNEYYPKFKLSLVLFDDAIQFLCKINRIISQPFGNSLLVGLGGTGCRTLSRLSAFMQDYKIGELDVDREFTFNEWYDFFRETLKQVGVKN
jgi:dynein heavy chain, axonemal